MVKTVRTSFGLSLYTPDGLSDTHDPHHNGKGRAGRQKENVGWEMGGPHFCDHGKLKRAPAHHTLEVIKDTSTRYR